MRFAFVRWLALAAITTVWALASSHAARTNSNENTNPRKAALIRERLNAFAFPDEKSHGWGSGSSIKAGRNPVGTMTATAVNASPGVTVGWTYHDLQHIGSMGRMVETGPHSGVAGQTTVHFGWMHLPDSAYLGRTYMYNAYKSATGTFAGAYRIHDYDDVYSGYVNVDVTPDNRALVGGHADVKGPVPYQAQIHFDACSACEMFAAYVRLPDSLAVYEQLDGNETTWPKFFFQFGSDTVLHIVAQNNTDNRTYNQTIMYFRKVGYEGTTTGWSYPPYCVDSVPIIAHDITGERLGDRVCMAWFANLPYQEPDCDTCSGTSPLEFGYMDNDLYLQISNDQGATWEPRQNITNIGINNQGYKPFCDASTLFDQDGYCHMVWIACPWPAVDEQGNFLGEFDPQKARLMHWSENVPYLRTIADHTYEPSDTCGAPRWAATIAKPSLAQCDGKLYTIWTQFNDIPNGLDFDCAEWRYTQNRYWGAANGDLWISVSWDGGMTWDAQRNLTNSVTPHCDPWGGEECQSDYWATINRWGKAVQGGEDWSGSVYVNPEGGVPSTDYFLDIMYVNDLDAGGAIWGDEGSWVNDPMKWFRLPCVEPVPNPLFACSWRNYGDPNYNKPGEEKLVDLDFENLGNVALTYTISVVEDNGPAGWLGYQNFSGTIPSGLGNLETGQVIVNVGGMIATTGNYTGRLHVTGNDPVNLPADIEIELIVADFIASQTWDSVGTNCLSLVVGNNGNMGKDSRGKANMDFYPEDCDSTAKVYLADGSPFVGRVIDSKQTITSSIWGLDYLDDNGFRPLGNETETRDCWYVDADVYETGTFTTQDSAIALEKVWVVPEDGCNFVLQYMRVWSFDGSTHDDLMLGEIIDWDIPWDYLADDIDLKKTAVNYGYFDAPRGLLYMQGYEAYGANADTGYPYNCQYNDERFAGHAFVESYFNGSYKSSYPCGGFIGENDSLVYPAREGFLVDRFWAEAIQNGLRGSDSVEDLHSAMTYEVGLDLSATDYYEVVTVLATIEQGDLADLQAAINAGKSWYSAHGGMAMFADNNADNEIDVCRFVPEWPVWRQVVTDRLALTVSNHGNMGKLGNGGVGCLNMDFYPDECFDDRTKVYLYDGSPIVGRWIDDGPVFDWSIWGTVYPLDHAFLPRGEQVDPRFCSVINAVAFESGTFTTNDEAIALEKTWIAPQGNHDFIIQHTRVWSTDEQAIVGVTVGEALDWNIPWDFDPARPELENLNWAGIDWARSLLYQRGYNATVKPAECPDNSTRLGGMAFVESYVEGAPAATVPYGGLIARNDALRDGNGFIHSLLWDSMMVSGLRGTDFCEDLHSIMTFGHDLTITDNKRSYEVVSILATVENGTLDDLRATVDAGRTWYAANGGIALFEDSDDDGRIDICDAPPLDIEWAVVGVDEIIDLTVSNHGNMGRMGNLGTGTLNLDFFPQDCDPNATVYLYDGSPVLGRGSQFDAAMWGATPGTSDHSFISLGQQLSTTQVVIGGQVLSIYQSGAFVTPDLALELRNNWIAWKYSEEGGTAIYSYLEVESFNLEAHSGLILGEAVDWNIPWDWREDDPEHLIPNVNWAGVDWGRNLLYQSGYETTVPSGCIYNDTRFGGLRFLESYFNDEFHESTPYGGFIGEVDQLRAGNGFDNTLLYNEMMQQGLRGTNACEDLVTVVTFENNLTLNPFDKYKAVLILVTSPYPQGLKDSQDPLNELYAAMDDAVAWYYANGGIDLFADNDGDGQMDICQSCCFKSGDFDHDGSLTPLDAVAFVNWLWRGGAGPSCEEEMDVNRDLGVNPLDAIYEVNYFWKGGPAPIGCP